MQFENQLIIDDSKEVKVWLSPWMHTGKEETAENTGSVVEHLSPAIYKDAREEVGMEVVLIISIKNIIIHLL